eukprot:Gb_37558 [translate_table: standard]
MHIALYTSLQPQLYLSITHFLPVGNLTSSSSIAVMVDSVLDWYHTSEQAISHKSLNFMLTGNLAWPYFAI